MPEPPSTAEAEAAKVQEKIDVIRRQNCSAGNGRGEYS